jgi:sulfur-carrier protein adenylyltransferase/sulfurtransferase
MLELTQSEIERYSRQIRLSEFGIQGQQKLKEASALLIGAGGLGSPVLQYLCASGIGTLGIVDNDWVDSSNLPRQLLYHAEDIGKPKVLVAKERLSELNPNIKFDVHFLRLNKETVLKIFHDYQIIVDCSDNFATRYLINDAAVILNKPVVYGAANKFTGQVTVLNYCNGPTLRCIYPVQPHYLDVPSCSETGVLGSLTGIIGAMQATEVIKIVLGLPDVLSGKYFVFDALTYSTQIFPFERNPDTANITALGDYDDICTDQSTSIKEITLAELEELKRKNPDLLVVDLRYPNERKSIGIDCTSIPYYEISNNIRFLADKSAVVFYCTYGIMSLKVINYLQSLHQMKNLYSLTIQ